MNSIKDLTPCERFVKNVVAHSLEPLTLAQIQKLTGYRTLPLVRTRVKFLTKARVLVESIIEGGEPVYSARVNAPKQQQQGA